MISITIRTVIIFDSDSYGNGKHSNQTPFFSSTIPRGWKLMEIEYCVKFNDFWTVGIVLIMFLPCFCCVFSWRCGSITGCFEILCENYLVFWIKCIPKNDSLREPSWPETWIVFFLGCKSNRTYSSVAWRMCAAANDVISPPHPPQGKPHKTHKAIQTHVGFSTR